MYTSMLTSKGQVTIPNKIRHRLELHPGDKVGFVIEDNQVILVRKYNNIKAAFGLCRAKRGASLANMEQAIHKGATDVQR